MCGFTGVMYVKSVVNHFMTQCSDPQVAKLQSGPESDPMVHAFYSRCDVWTSSISLTRELV